MFRLVRLRGSKREVEPNRTEERFHEILHEKKGDIAGLEYTWNVFEWS